MVAVVDHCVQMSTSLKVLLDNWNKMTTQWLRLIVYERYNNSMLVFLFSASWHGFYAGYYLTFLFGGLFIYVARMVGDSSSLTSQHPCKVTA